AVAHGNQGKVIGWYDNEWGYSSRLADPIDRLLYGAPSPIGRERRRPRKARPRALRPERPARGRARRRRHADPRLAPHASTPDRARSRGDPQLLTPRAPERTRPRVRDGARAAAAGRAP